MSTSKVLHQTWIELFVWFFAMTLLLFWQGSQVNWWQLVVLMVTFLILYFLTGRFGYNSLALPLVSFLVILGWIFLARLHVSLATGQFWGFLLGALAYGLGLFLPFWKKDYTRVWIGGALLPPLITTLFGQSVRGAKAWLSISTLHIQPVEFARIFLVLYLGCSLGKERPKREFLSVMGIFLLFLAWQRDLGPALLTFFVICCLSLYKNFSWMKVTIYLGTTILGFLGAVHIFPHLQSRMDAWIWPWNYLDSKGYQVLQGLFALRAGGIAGKGIGFGMAQVIPEVHTDYIFTIIGEELGILGTFSLLIIYLTLAYWAFQLLLQVEDVSLRLCGLGLTLLLHGQVFLVVGGILRLWPFTGMTLPFVSYGSNSLIAQLLMLGIVTGLRRETR